METTRLHCTGTRSVWSCAEALHRRIFFSKSQVVRSLLLRGSGTAARFVINAISTEAWRCLVGTELSATFSQRWNWQESCCACKNVMPTSRVAEGPSHVREMMR